MNIMDIMEIFKTVKKTVNIDIFRKSVFINSQYCNWYNVGNNTILAGIMRNIGYFYKDKLSAEDIQSAGKIYRKYTTIMNCVVGVEILLYIYLVIFPFFLQFMKQQFIISVLALSIIPLLALYLSYIVVNKLYENEIFKTIGEAKKTVFKPTLKNIDEQAFQTYLKTPKKSIYVVLLLAIIFLGYVLTPLTIQHLNRSEKYNSVIRLSNIYLKIVPIASNVYPQRAYAKLKLGQYEAAVADYKLANEYSLSDTYSSDIVGVKTYYMPYKKMLGEFDRAMNEENIEAAKYLLRYEKAVYQLKNKDYKTAYAELNNLINAYSQNKDVFFSPAYAYYNRGVARAALGDGVGAKADKAKAKSMCPECKFNQETTLIHTP